ncbi:SURF1 family cytochrome oxidase biogenesis protein [Streptomyces sp. NPDC014734]|uniref:SURF1 family protein n=1 Tax=Streptomyces sp. NPDC014734 TaxID=3364886 RepID=UPI0036FA0B7D
MYRFLLTPRWWGINLFVVLAIPFCVFMGTWQLGRFEDRVQTHNAAEKQPAPGTRAAEPIDDLLPVDLETSGRPATATGRYADQFLVPHRELDGKNGFYVLSMLRTNGGRALPVVRGWLPGKPGRTAVPAAPAGTVTVTGDLQASENAGTSGVDAGGGLPTGQLGMISAATLVNLVPYDVYDAWVTLQDTGAVGGLRPVPAAAAQGTGLDLKAFQNLGYTGEWFVFAGFVLFMWFRLVRRETEAARDLKLGLVTETSADVNANTDPGVAADSGPAADSGVNAGSGPASDSGPDANTGSAVDSDANTSAVPTDPGVRPDPGVRSDPDVRTGAV